MPTTLQPLAPPVIADRLARELPRWTLAQGQLARTYVTENWKSTLMAVVALGHLAEAAWHHPELEVTYRQVRVRLSTHEAGGVTDRDFELARKMEAVLLWQPGQEGGALTGTPQDPASRYLHYPDA